MPDGLLSPEQWDRIRQVFAAAQELNASEREAFVERQCGADLLLEREVKRLLILNDNVGSFLEGPSPAISATDHEPLEATVLCTGDVIARRFTIVGLLGRGGMGEVYEAEDAVLGDRVAVKVMRPGDDAEALARFRREVQLARRVSHPGVCRVHDVTFHSSAGDNLIVLTMELVRGETLAARLRQGLLATDVVLDIARQVGSALDAAHHERVIHRDIKPSNILLEPRKPGGYRAVLTDFGVARAMEAGATSKQTRRGTFLGTPEYMAPEVLHGGVPSIQSDLFSFAVVIYEMATGRHPYLSDWLEGDENRRSSRLHNIVRSLDPVWAKTLSRALDADPRHRFASSRELLDALGSSADDHAANAPAESPHAGIIANDHGRLADVARPIPVAGATPQRADQVAGRASSGSSFDGPMRLREASSETALPSEPYPLLGPYEHARTFAGRAAEIAKLETLVRLPQLVLSVHAASGAGKSSLLLAGLAPSLRAAGYVVSVERGPGDAGLAQRIVRDILEPAESITLNDDDPELPLMFAKSIALAFELSRRPIVLVVDQIDDVMRNTAKRDNALARIGLLLAATAQRLPGVQGFACKWVLCYRHEFHGEVRAWLEDVLVQARALGCTGLASLPYDLSDPQKSHDWAIPVVGRPSPGDDIGQSSKQAFLDAIRQPLELIEGGHRRYPYVISLDGAERLARAFTAFRLEQPDAPLVPELQVVLSYLIQRETARIPASGRGVPAPIEIPGDEELEKEIRHALSLHVERALNGAFPQERQTTTGRLARTRALMALRQLADAQGRRTEGLLEEEIVRMIGPLGQQVVDKLSSPTARLVFVVRGRCTLSHDRLAEVVADLVRSEQSRRGLAVDSGLIEVERAVGQKVALYESDHTDQSALALTRHQRELITANVDTLLFDDARLAWWAASNTYDRQLAGTTRKRVAAATAAVLAAIVAVTFNLQAYRQRLANREADSLLLLKSQLIGRLSAGDLHSLAGLARDRGKEWARIPGGLDDQFVMGINPALFAAWSTPEPPYGDLLDVIQSGYPMLIHSRKLFGAMSFALEEVALRRASDSQTVRRAEFLLNSIRAEFITFHKRDDKNFQDPPAVPTQDTLNAWIALPGGEFTMGIQEYLRPADGSAHRVRLKPFLIQRFEVTNEEYIRFDPQHAFDPGRERHPVVEISWYEAVAYGAWLGATLPTESQWEYAARGTGAEPPAGKKGRIFPWGWEKPTPSRATIGLNATEPVGSRPEGRTPEGIADMGGNVWEWCRDWYRPYEPSLTVSTDPLGSPTGDERVMRGAGYHANEAILRGSYRESDVPAFHGDRMGVRLVSPRVNLSSRAK